MGPIREYLCNSFLGLPMWIVGLCIVRPVLNTQIDLSISGEIINEKVHFQQDRIFPVSIRAIGPTKDEVMNSKVHLQASIYNLKDKSLILTKDLDALEESGWSSPTERTYHVGNIEIPKGKYRIVIHNLNPNDFWKGKEVHLFITYGRGK